MAVECRCEERYKPHSKVDRREPEGSLRSFPYYQTNLVNDDIPKQLFVVPYLSGYLSMGPDE